MSASSLSNVLFAASKANTCDELLALWLTARDIIIQENYSESARYATQQAIELRLTELKRGGLATDEGPDCLFCEAPRSACTCRGERVGPVLRSRRP